jgi:hypothetical protein
VINRLPSDADGIVGQPQAGVHGMVSLAGNGPPGSSGGTLRITTMLRFMDTGNLSLVMSDPYLGMGFSISLPKR